MVKPPKIIIALRLPPLPAFYLRFLKKIIRRGAFAQFDASIEIANILLQIRLNYFANEYKLFCFLLEVTICADKCWRIVARCFIYLLNRKFFFVFSKGSR